MISKILLLNLLHKLFLLKGKALNKLQLNALLLNTLEKPDTSHKKVNKIETKGVRVKDKQYIQFKLH